MLITVIGFILNGIAFVLFVLAARFWFPIWRNINGRSGTAHALFLTCAALGVATVLKLTQTIPKLFTDVRMDDAVNLTATMLMLFVSICQYALMKGYFNMKENDDGRID